MFHFPEESESKNIMPKWTLIKYPVQSSGNSIILGRFNLLEEVYDFIEIAEGIVGPLVEFDTWRIKEPSIFYINEHDSNSNNYIPIASVPVSQNDETKIWGYFVVPCHIEWLYMF